MTDFTLTTGADVFPDSGQDITGNDRIFGLGGADQIHGGDGNDAINGGTEADTLFGDAGDDTLDAGLLPLQDVLDGGTGTDLAVLDYEGVINLATNVSVRVVAQFSTGSWATVIDGITGATVMNCEHIDISSGNAADFIVGGAGDDTLTSLGGADRLYGGAGNDVIAKTWGHYDLRGGLGIDQLLVTGTDFKEPGTALIFDARTAVGTLTCGTTTSGSFREFERYSVGGTAAGDTVHLGARADFAAGAAGDDLLDGLAGNDTLDGGAGTDTIFGGDGADILTTGTPADGATFLHEQVFGGAGNDAITAETSFAGGVLRTFAGVTFDGGLGHDTLEITGQNEVEDLSGATITGIEKLSYFSGLLGGVILTAGQFNSITDFNITRYIRIASVGDLVAHGQMFMTEIKLFDGGQKIDLSGSTKPFSDFGPFVTGGAGNDVMIGSARRDSFTGGAGDDSLSSGAGNDTLTGLDGNDTLFGSLGDDLLNGGLGVDRETGGAGADSFTFYTAADSGVGAGARDILADFTVNPLAGTAFVDRLNLSVIDAKAGTATNDAFVYIGQAAFTAEGQIRAVQMAGDTLVQVNTAGPGVADMEIVLHGFTATQLTNADFVF